MTKKTKHTSGGICACKKEKSIKNIPYVAVITGASSGIGREFARQIAAAYPSLDEIWILARRLPALRELEAELSGKKVRILSLDLTEASALEALEELLKKERPCIRILVNSAGCGKSGPVESQNWRDAARMLDVNCRALTAVTMICLPYLRRGSRIIQAVSGSAFLPQPGFAVYAAGKSYVLSFDQALAAELRDKKITVTSVCPGPVDTEFFAAGGITLNPWKKIFLAKPEKVVKKALFDAEAKKELSIYRCSIPIVRLAEKLLPRKLLLGIMRRIFL